MMRPAPAHCGSMLEGSPITTEELAALEAVGLGAVGAKLLRRIEHDRQVIDWRDAKLEKLTFEMAQLKRMKFGRRANSSMPSRRPCSTRQSMPTSPPPKTCSRTCWRRRSLRGYLDDPALPIDNNHDEQQIRPWATVARTGGSQGR